MSSSELIGSDEKVFIATDTWGFFIKNFSGLGVDVHRS
jgi:hypothetical protein